MTHTSEEGEFKLIPIEQLQSGKYQPRKDFTSVELQELADSIRVQGMIQPIIARPIDATHYEIIAGERRWRAAQSAGLKEVPCLIRQLSDEQAAMFAIIENIQRANLNPIEEALAYQKLYDEFGYKEAEIAEKVGKSRSAVSHIMRLIMLEGRIQELLINGILQIGHGKVLASLPKTLQVQLGLQAAARGWSVRELEKAVKSSAKIAKELKSRDVNLMKIERALSEYIGYPVNIEDKDGRGHIKINYFDLEALDGIFQKINFKYE